MADAIHDIEMQRVLGERDGLIKRAIQSLATRLGVDNEEIDTIVSDLKESETTVEQRVIYDIKNKFRTRKQPVMSLSQNEANHRDFEINMYDHENNRLLQRSEEESRQIRLHDGPEASFIQIAASPQLPFGAAALHQPGPPVLNVDPTLAAQKKLHTEAARFVIEDESYIGFIPGTSRRYDRPLEYPKSVTVDLFANQIAAAKIPVTKSMDYLRLLKEIILRAEQIGLTDSKLRQGILLVCDVHFQHLVDPLQRLREPPIFFDCVSDFVNLSDNRIQIQSALNQLTRQPNENFCTPIRTHLTLQLMKFEISHPMSTYDEQLRKAKRVVRNLATCWLSPACAQKYKVWVKTRVEQHGRSPEMEEIISVINRLESEPGMQLQHAVQMSSTDANRVELFKFQPRARDNEVVEHNAAGAGGQRVLPSGWGGREGGFPMFAGRSRENSRGRDSGSTRPPSSVTRTQDNTRRQSRNRGDGNARAENKPQQNNPAASNIYKTEAQPAISGQGVPIKPRPRSQSAGRTNGAAPTTRGRSTSRRADRAPAASGAKPASQTRAGRSTSRQPRSQSRGRGRSQSQGRSQNRNREAETELSALVGRQELLISRLRADKRALLDKYEPRDAAADSRNPFGSPN